MTRNNEDGKSPSKSFIMGAVALAFLLIGYQTAVFIHRAATLRILADTPDTVYVAVPQVLPVDSGQTSSGIPGAQASTHYAHSGGRSQTKSSLNAAGSGSTAGHRREEVRERFSGPRCENFRFDPNTATIDELRRLGFSLRQAEAIDNYRSKGGRFRRKSDFAKSYVVEDSVFRRLEPYIDIPLVDLNTADSAMFET
ncbi:MAG: ComEA family DNA-binding protein, partial [Candidatus Cryptobacteroides sp.]